MTMTTDTAVAELVFIDGKSAKFWNARVVGNVLHTAWGRIGTTGQTKEAAHPDGDAARAAFDKAVREKAAKGYVPNPDTNPEAAAATGEAVRTVGVPDMRPMLATEIEAVAMDTYIDDIHYNGQQKVDGTRLLISLSEGAATVIGRNGQSSQYQPKFSGGPHAAELARLHATVGDVVLDGELVGDTLHLFDMPTCPARNIDQWAPYAARADHLAQLYAAWAPNPDLFALLPTATTTEAKAALAVAVFRNGGEGVMFKHVAAAYEPGVRSEKTLKAKFVRTADCVVTAIGQGGKDNYVLAVYDDNGNEIGVGKCSAIGKTACAVGDVVEVKYLYLGADNKLFQPRMLRRRTDKAAAECAWSQVANAKVNKTVLPAAILNA